MFIYLFFKVEPIVTILKFIIFISYYLDTLLILFYYLSFTTWHINKYEFFWHINKYEFVVVVKLCISLDLLCFFFFFESSGLSFIDFYSLLDSCDFKICHLGLSSHKGLNDILTYSLQPFQSLSSHLFCMASSILIGKNESIAQKIYFVWYYCFECDWQGKTNKHLLL